MGELLRHWRAIRRLSQLALALEASTTARHLSFIESGRSQPSPEMVLRLARALDVPIRERNQLLLAARDAPPTVRRAWTAHRPHRCARRSAACSPLTSPSPPS